MSETLTKCKGCGCPLAAGHDACSDRCRDLETELTHEEAERIVDELYSVDVESYVYDGLYSGRAMYGRRCVAIVVRGFPDLAALGYAAAVAEVPFDHVPRRTDDLGYDTVVY